MADAEHTSSAVRISRTRRRRGFAQSPAQKILARVGLNGHEIIAVCAFQFALETILVDLLHPFHEVS
jgi:hypothetical protein